MARLPRPTRRDFLKTGSLAAGAAALPGRTLDALARLGGPKTEHVVLVAFAGGVRQKEVIGTPENVPNLMRIASAGCVFPRVHCENVGHYGAALSIFTGNVEVMGIRENERGLDPTLFEFLRKDAGLGPTDVWLSTSSGAQGRLFAHSDHPSYGAEFAANVLDGDGLFNVEFKRVLDSFGKPREDTPHDRDVVARIGAALDEQALVTGTDRKRPDTAQVQRVAGFILDELTGKTSRITGPGAGDAKAIRVGLNLLRVFKPRLLGIALQNHDIAHGSFNGYVEVIRRNDAELGKLWDAIQQDDDLRDKTAVLVLPEFGRDKNLNERNGLDHGDSSDELHEVFLIAAGPDFKSGKVIRSEIRTIDVCPTVWRLFSRRPLSHVTGRTIDDLFA